MELPNTDWAAMVYGDYPGQQCRFPGCAQPPAVRLVGRYQAEPALSWRAPDERDKTPYYCTTHDREAKQHLAMLVKKEPAQG